MPCYDVMKFTFVIPLFILSCSTPEHKPEKVIVEAQISDTTRQSSPIIDTIIEETIPVSQEPVELSFSKNTEAIKLNWQELEEGLLYRECKGPILGSINDSKLRILKINPTKFSIQLSSAKELKTSFKTAPQWAEKEGFIALVNAGMFQFDEYGTNTSYMQNYNFINNPKLSRDNTIAAFNPKDSSVPPFQIIDRKCQNFDSLRTKYNTLIQGIRMMDCGQHITWSQQKKYWSTVCLGSNKAGDMLFIFTRSPFSVHDFITNIKAVVPDVYNLMYLEGGPEASFYINHPNIKVEQMGSYETDFFESDDNNRFWDLPNVIGIKLKE